MRGPDVHLTGHGPGPATDQWSCDCGQHDQKVPSLHLCQSVQPTQKEVFAFLHLESYNEGRLCKINKACHLMCLL